MADLLTYAYMMSGFLFGMAFIPQIVALRRNRSNHTDLSLGTWLLFTLCSAITFAYALVQNGDAHFIIVASIGVAGNSTVLFLASYKKLAAAR